MTGQEHQPQGVVLVRFLREPAPLLLLVLFVGELVVLLVQAAGPADVVDGTAFGDGRQPGARIFRDA